MTAGTLQGPARRATGPARRATGAAGRCYRAGKKPLRKLGTLQRAGRLQAGRYSGHGSARTVAHRRAQPAKPAEAAHGTATAAAGRRKTLRASLTQGRSCAVGRTARQASEILTSSLCLARIRARRQAQAGLRGRSNPPGQKAKRTVPLWQTDVNRREDVRLLPAWPCS